MTPVNLKQEINTVNPSARTNQANDMSYIVYTLH